LLGLLLICTLHIGFSKSIIDSNQNYLLAPFNNGYVTVGGFLIALITFPLKAIFGFSYTLLLIIQFAINVAITLIPLYLYFTKKSSKEKIQKKKKPNGADEIELYSRRLRGDPESEGHEPFENQPKIPLDYDGVGRIFLDPSRVKGNRSISEVFDNAGKKRAPKPHFTVIGDFHREMQIDPFKKNDTKTKTVQEVFGESSVIDSFKTLDIFDSPKRDNPPIQSNPISDYINSFKPDLKDDDSYRNKKTNSIVNDDSQLKDEIADIIRQTPLSTTESASEGFVDRAVKNSLNRYNYSETDNSHKNAYDTVHSKINTLPDNDHQGKTERYIIERHVTIENHKENVISPSDSFTNKTTYINQQNSYRDSLDVSLNQHENKSVKSDETYPVPQSQVKPQPIFERPVLSVPTGMVVPKLKSLRHPYCAPPHSLLKTYSTDKSNYPSDYVQRKEQIENELMAAGISANVYSATKGAVFTRYELRLDNALQVSKVKSLNVIESLKMRLMVEVLEIEAPIKGKDAVGILFQNAKAETVGLKSIICSSEFICDNEGISFALGQDIDGKPHVANLAETSHLIVAGATNTGKSVFMNSMLISILFKHSPEEVRFIIIDPKRVEFVSYKGLPHMLIRDPITEIGPSLAAINWVINEMERRYTLLETYSCRKLDEYNNVKRDKVNEPRLPRILLVVDEMADLMLRARGQAEENLTRIAQKGRAAGIHMVIATQKPTVNIISGLISANVVNRVAFQVIKNVDSRIILDDNGAEDLVGRGDMLYKSNVDIKRMQGVYLDSSEIDAVCDFIKENNEGHFDEELDAYIRKEGATHQEKQSSDLDGGMSSGENDALFRRVLKGIILDGKASTNSVVTNYNISYIRAKRMIDAMTKKGYLARENGNKARDVLISYDDYKSLYGEDE
jgi:DNA segregation ATPase FtsK/SpoIIIE-like protein